MKSRTSPTIASTAMIPIANASTIESAIGTQRTRSCDAARIQVTSCTKAERRVRRGEPEQGDADHRQRDGLPPVQDVRDVEQTLDCSDPERDPQAPFAQPAARIGRAMFDHLAPGHAFQPYHADAVSHVSTVASSCADSLRRWARVWEVPPVTPA